MHSIKVKCWEEENQKHQNVFTAFKFGKFQISKCKSIFLRIAKVICFINALSKIAYFVIILLNLGCIIW